MEKKSKKKLGLAGAVMIALIASTASAAITVAFTQNIAAWNAVSTQTANIENHNVNGITPFVDLVFENDAALDGKITTNTANISINGAVDLVNSNNIATNAATISTLVATVNAIAPDLDADAVNLIIAAYLTDNPITLSSLSYTPGSTIPDEYQRTNIAGQINQSFQAITDLQTSINEQFGDVRLELDEALEAVQRLTQAVDTNFAAINLNTAYRVTQ